MATEEVTRVEQAYFENPVKRIGVSGGTAPFFALKLTKEGINKFGTEHACNNDATISETYFIGKDLSRSVDEAQFYERTLGILKCNEDESAKDDGGLGKLLEKTFEYLGVVTLEEIVDGSPVEREMLVLKNLYDSLSKLRLLDFKMGDRTADSNWRGKSRARAYKQRVLDGFTNSTKEGFRLEGFDGKPQAIISMDPLLDLRFSLVKSPGKNSGKEKKAARFALQRLTGSEALMHYLDLHEVSASEESSLACDDTKPFDDSIAVNDSAEIFDKQLSIETSIITKSESLKLKDGSEESDFIKKADVYTTSEVAEIVLHETVRQLIQLSATCHNTTVPQKWLGSSVALGYDAEYFPVRSNSSEQKIRSNVIVSIFDWGKSELLTKEAFDKLSAAEKDDREKFWDYYMHGVDNLSFDAVTKYYNQFSNSHGWDDITVRVMDYDSSNDDDFMGEVNLTLPKDLTTTWSEEFPLRNKGKPFIRGRSKGGQRGSIKLDISWWDAPKISSRIRGSWRITVSQASNLKALDVISSDPYCLITARSGSFEYTQMTSVKMKTLNPIWRETLELPVVSNGSELLDSLHASGLPVDSKKLTALFHKKGKVSCTDWAQLF